LKNDVGDHFVMHQISGDSSTGYEAALIGIVAFSLFGGKLAAAPFGTFATLSAL
jgi:hypothetical protein